MKRHIARWPVDRLKAHPLQASLFSDLGAQAFKDLVEDIKLRGLQKPVEVLPDGTIICGHQRWRAIKALGRKEIAVWIRDDLAEAGEAAIEQYLITDNLHRRHLDKLDIARCFARLRDLEHTMPADQRHSYSGGGDLRDMRAKKIGGGSGRNMERYLRVLSCPQEVQQALQTGKISLVEASKVARLAAKVQNEIATAIRAGQGAKAVVRAQINQRRKPAAQKESLAQQAAEIDRLLGNMEKELGDGALGLQSSALLFSAKQKIEKLLSQKGTAPSG